MLPNRLACRIANNVVQIPTLLCLHMQHHSLSDTSSCGLDISRCTVRRSDQQHDQNNARATPLPGNDVRSSIKASTSAHTKHNKTEATIVMRTSRLYENIPPSLPPKHRNVPRSTSHYTSDESGQLTKYYNRALLPLLPVATEGLVRMYKKNLGFSNISVT